MPQPISRSQAKRLKDLGERFKSIRESKGLSLEQVAQAIGKDRQSIHRLEKGQFNPSIIYLLEVCKGLEVKIGEVLGDF